MSQQTGSWQVLDQPADPLWLRISHPLPHQIAGCKFFSWTSITLSWQLSQNKAAAFQLGSLWR